MENHSQTQMFNQICRVNVTNVIMANLDKALTEAVSEVQKQRKDADLPPITSWELLQYETRDNPKQHFAHIGLKYGN